jgi:hypothetical protein
MILFQAANDSTLIGYDRWRYQIVASIDYYGRYGGVCQKFSFPACAYQMGYAESPALGA